MLFNSLEFGVFFAVVFAIYAMLRHRAQNLLLLAASYVFYGAWDWRFLGLILLSTVVDFLVGARLHASSDAAMRKRWLLLSLSVNLGLLGVFKYFDFFAGSLEVLLSAFGFEASSWRLGIVLPVGISFYTFQTLSYTIDIYRKNLEPTRNFLDFALFVAFFPQLVAGPIERAKTLLPQITSPRILSWKTFNSGGWLIFSGLVKKVVVADNLAVFVNATYSNAEQATSGAIALATYAFAFQIYCDFSGYSDLARGLARVLGFELMVNFNLPYISANPAEFWRRWHISLSTWLRDYLYISLGGNRGGTGKTARNLALTMLLGGLWHGAAWTYVLWGAYQGALLMVHRWLRPQLGRLRFEGWAATAWLTACRLATFQLVCLGWMIFRADGMGQLTTLLTRLISAPGGVEWASLRAFLLLVLPVVFYQWLQHRAGDLEVVLRWPVPVRAACYTGLGLAVLLLGVDLGQQFIYFQF